MKKVLAFIPILLGVIIISCEALEPPKMILNRSVGNSGDLTVAISGDLWSSGVGKQIRKRFDSYEPGLGKLMAEKRFKIKRVTPDQFSTLNTRNRNVLHVSLAGDLPKDSIALEVKEDYYANHQLYVQIRANNSKSLEKFLKENGIKLRKKFEKAELERLVETFKTHPSKRSMDSVKKYFDIDMTLDKGYRVASHENNFMIIERNNSFQSMELNIGGKEKLNILEGIMIWQHDFHDQIQLDKKYIHRERDTTLKYNVRFPKNVEAYLGTEYDPVFEPKQRKVAIDGEYAIESRGRIKAINHVMGGPFIQVTFVHPKTQKVINVLGWVHAPNVEKMELMRQLQASLHHIDCIE